MARKKGLSLCRIRLTSVIFACLLCLSLGVYAAPESTSTEQLYQAIEKMLTENADLDDFAATAQGEQAANALLAPNLFSFGLSQLREAFSAGISSLLPLLTVIFLSTAIGIFNAHLGSGARLIEYTAQLGIIFIVFASVKPLISAVDSYLEKYAAFMTSVSATMSVMLAAGGGGSAAAASSASAAFAVSITQLCSQGIVLPCVRIVLALCAIGTLSHAVDLSGVINFLRGFCTWGLGVLFAVFGGVHAATVKIAAGADTLAVRGIRFTAARLIPVAGNMISECLRTVISGMAVIKNTLGALGIAYILYTLIPVLCTVLVVKLAVLAASFCSKLMGSRTHTAFLDGVGGALNILMAAAIFASVSGILIFAVFMQTTLAV